MNDQRAAAVPAYVGIGSNMDDPAAQVRRALEAIEAIAETEIAKTSSLYSSAPFGPVEQPDFLNAVAQLRTRLSASDLLRQLQAIERAQGRVRGERWGPRCIDLDLLTHDDTICDTEELMLPHPGIAERNFVLLPLLEIAPELAVPGLGLVFRHQRSGDDRA